MTFSRSTRPQRLFLGCLLFAVASAAFTFEALNTWTAHHYAPVLAQLEAE